MAPDPRDAEVQGRQNAPTTWALRGQKPDGGAVQQPLGSWEGDEPPPLEWALERHPGLVALGAPDMEWSIVEDVPR